ncbi:SPOR domain-containing protein [Azospirillum sp. YIM DDC1]|uniref:SPOR domain-containing protein n=1 Tax=Azospirillum aestuarii TaxID=2802052 RepID=A0ABS1I5U4_9PROT|nr:SPOR domain-containing protein [Azospirillum aestuarii]MBK4722435.1 SPOR domain-containing protein [Azospirillum aestuarii]TWA80468.1 sporulation related protein [Azospirillum brasilense]
MKKLLVGVLALLLLLVAFAGGYFLAGGSVPGATDDPAPAEAKAAPAAVPQETAKAEPEKAAPAAVPVRPVASVKAATARFSIELGVFRSAGNAQDFAAALAGRGLPVEIVETMDAAGGQWHRVRAGAFADRWQAEARRPSFERTAGIGGVVVEEPLAAAMPTKAGGGE